MSEILPPPILNLRASLKKPIRWAMAAGLVTALISLFLPNYYKSEARLLPVEASAAGGIGGLAAAAAAFGVGIGGNGGSDANFVDILNSRWLLENLLDRKAVFNYHVRKWRFGKECLESGSLYDYLGKDNMDSAVRALDAILDVKKDLKSNVITLSAETKSPELSQEVVHKALDLLNRFVTQNTRSRGAEKAAFAEARLVDARLEMDRSEVLFKDFLEVNRNYQSSAEPSVRLKGARLEAELNLRRQIVSTLALNREQSLLDAKNDVPILNLLDAGNLPIEKSKPVRSMFVIFTAFIIGIVVWGWQNWQWIQWQLRSDESI